MAGVTKTPKAMPDIRSWTVGIQPDRMTISRTENFEHKHVLPYRIFYFQVSLYSILTELFCLARHLILNCLSISVSQLGPLGPLLAKKLNSNFFGPTTNTGGLTSCVKGRKQTLLLPYRQRNDLPFAYMQGIDPFFANWQRQILNFFRPGQPSHAIHRQVFQPLPYSTACHTIELECW